MSAKNGALQGEHVPVEYAYICHRLLGDPTTMLAKILAIAVGSGSFILFMAAFFFPEVYRKGDFIWSGVGIFYAIVLWFCAGQATGAELLGETASVALIFSLGGQLLVLRRQGTPRDQQTSTEAIDTSNKTGGLFGGFGSKAKPQADPSPSDQAIPKEPKAGIATEEPQPTSSDMDLSSDSSTDSSDLPGESTEPSASNADPQAVDEDAIEAADVADSVNDEVETDIAASEPEIEESEAEEPKTTEEDDGEESVSLATNDEPDEIPGETPEAEPTAKTQKSGGILGSIGALFGRKAKPVSPESSESRDSNSDVDPLEDWDDDEDSDELDDASEASMEIESDESEPDESEPDESESDSNDRSESIASDADQNSANNEDSDVTPTAESQADPEVAVEAEPETGDADEEEDENSDRELDQESIEVETQKGQQTDQTDEAKS
jgi:hypothetical protein